MSNTSNDILNLRCSFIPFPSAPVREVTLGDCLFRFPYFRTNQERINKCRDEARRHDAKTDSGRTTKKQLPLWSPGRWCGTMKKGEMLEFGGYMFFDIDEDDNKSITPEEMKARVSGIASVAVAAISARGCGIWGLVKVPDDASDENLLKGYFRAFSEALRGVGLVGDPSATNCNRGRYISIDDNPYLADDAEVWSEWQDEERKTPIRAKRRNPALSYKPTSQLERVERLAARCSQLGRDPFPTQREWFFLARALAGVFGESGRGAFQTFSNIWETSTGRRHEIDPNTFYDSVLKMGGQWDSLGVIFARCAEVGVYAR